MTTATTTLPALASDAPTAQPEAVVPASPVPPFAFHRPLQGARLVAMADAAVVMGALLLVIASRSTAVWPANLTELLSLSVSLGEALQLVAVAGASVIAFWAAGAYDATRVRRRTNETIRIAAGTAALATMLPVFVTGEVAAGFSRTPDLDTSALFSFFAIAAAGVASLRAARAAVVHSEKRSRRALIVGSGPHALRVCRDLSSNGSTPYRVLGFVDTISEAVPRSRFVARRTVGTLDELESILAREHVDEVHVGLPVRSHYRQIQEIVRVCERVGVKLLYRADIFDTVLARPQVDGASPRVALRVVTEGFPVAVKRAIDIIGASVGLIAFAPLMLAVAIAIRLTSEGPIIFGQERYGLNRRRFRMLKFRTMVQNAETLQAQLEAQNESKGPMFKIARDPRITPIGRILRRTSIDELPQLFNVLRGDMSLIGPRPLPLRDVARFTRTSDLRRFSVRPGCTGLWQVSGRSNPDAETWIKLDLHYIDHWSLRLDFIVLARTIPAVIRGTGAA